MAWLRPRRRSLDIVCETDERGNGLKELHSMNNGTYNAKGSIRNRSRTNSENVTSNLKESNPSVQNHSYVTGLIEPSHDVMFIKVEACKTDDENFLTSESNDVSPSFDPSTSEQEDLGNVSPRFGSIISEQEEDGNSESPKFDSSISDQSDLGDAVFIDENFNDINEEEPPSRRWTLDIYPTTKNVETLSPHKEGHVQHSSSATELYQPDLTEDEESQILKSCIARPRHSFDSQMMLSPMPKNRLQSLPELQEANIGDKERTRRKSISWAEDLETIHEFEKIKNRRLSLSGLFKKF